jgi:hypothetical protein
MQVNGERIEDFVVQKSSCHSGHLINESLLILLRIEIFLNWIHQSSGNIDFKCSFDWQS